MSIDDILAGNRHEPIEVPAQLVRWRSRGRQHIIRARSFLVQREGRENRSSSKGRYSETGDPSMRRKCTAAEASPATMVRPSAATAQLVITSSPVNVDMMRLLFRSIRGSCGHLSPT